MRKKKLGVLGGLGPLATVDFLDKFYRLSQATVDQDHPLIAVRFCTQAPDRSAFLNGTGLSPLPDMIAAAQAMREEGAEAAVLLCNTAHIWLDEIAEAAGLPFLDIAKTALAEVRVTDAPVGVLCTPWTVMGKVYSRHAGRITLVEPSHAVLNEILMPAIRAVKAGRLEEGRLGALMAIEYLQGQGCESVVFGCTELPLVLSSRDTDMQVIDATESLARAALRWSHSDVDSEGNAYLGARDIGNDACHDARLQKVSSQPECDRQIPNPEPAPL